MKQVWDSCEGRDLGVSAAHIAEKENVQADRESRTEGHVDGNCLMMWSHT